MRTCTSLLALAALTLAADWDRPAAAQRNARVGRVVWWSSARAVPVAAYANNARLETDALMLKGTGRTVLPMRALFTALGADVEWNAAERAVYAWQPGGTGVRFEVGGREATILAAPENPAGTDRPTVKQRLPLDTPAMLIGNRIYVPVRAAAEALQAGVHWVGTEPAIYLYSNGDGETKSAAPDVDIRALNLALEIPRRRFRLGEQVPLELILTNVGSETVTLRFGTTQEYDLQVLQNGRVVWTWSRGRSFSPLLLHHRLTPGETDRFTATWNQRSNQGRPVAPGRYTVRGFLMPSARVRNLSVDQEIEITR